MAQPATTPFVRSQMVERLRTESFDVLVVGGGITGCGVALDAARRGLRTALVERDDFGSGTSSKSSKMVHGGLRYLQQGEVRLVYEALRERERLRRNAPHLVSTLPFMIPILTKDGVVPRKVARALGSAMWMYDLTGGWRIGRLHRRLRAPAALAHFPTMAPERLAAAYLYFDAAVDDARLCLTVARTAAQHGAAVANRCKVVAMEHAAGGTARGAVVECGDGPAFERFTVRATTIVNAAGVWSDEVRALDEGRHPASIRPAKGVHIVIPWDKVGNDIAVIIPVPKDRRSVFVVPWGRRPDGTFDAAYVGTTDTDYHGPLDDPQCTKDDIDYVLRALNASVTTRVTEADIIGTWAGLRPLLDADHDAKTTDLSRRHAVTTSASGVVTVTGGKLTTYREMAEDTVDVVAERLGRRVRCATRRLPLVGAGGHQAIADEHLRGRYGSLATEVLQLVGTDPELRAPLVDGLPYLAAEAVYAVRAEMAITLDDVLTRRTRARLLHRDATVAAAPSVAELIAPELGWDDAERARQLADFLGRCAAERAAAGATEPQGVR